MARVELQGLRKTFADGTVAVHGLDLDIADREFISLLGPSGCGKTTTLRMIAGLESPSAGSIRFDGRDVTEEPPARRNIAMVFQSYALYPHMTVRGNLEYPLRKRGVPAAERGPMIERTAAMLQISPLLDRRPRQLSGGQQQRVALGRAMIRDPQVFLLDEPLSNLDAKLRAHMRAELIQLRRRIGKTMIYVTHDQHEALTMSDRIAVMSEGHLQQLGAPDEIYRRPVNRFVAAFVGTPAMNFLSGELVEEAGALVVRTPQLAVTLGAERARAVAGGTQSRRVVIGVRPEDVLIGEGQVMADVTVVEATGYETIVFLEVAGASLVARAAADLPVRAMARVPIRLRESKLHLFDAETGRRLVA